MKKIQRCIVLFIIALSLSFSVGATYLEKCEHIKVDNRCSKCDAYYVKLNETVNVLDPESGSRYGFIQWGTTEGIEYIEDVIDVKPGVNGLDYKIYSKIKGVKIGEWELGLYVNGNLVDIFLVVVECNHIVENFKSNNDATCSIEGTKTGFCTLCNEEITEIDIGTKLEHTFIFKSEIASTCTENGSKLYECYCGESYTETIPATNHVDAALHEEMPATCTQIGYTEGRYCSYCDFWVEGHEILPIIDHTYEATITTPNTCTENGIVTYKCICSKSYTEILPATNHINATVDNGTPATCTQTGFTTGKYCPDCDTWLEGHEIIPTIDHTYTSAITTEPTCWRDGVITYTCECGDSYTEDIEKNDHDYNEWWVKTKPTCTKAGLEWTYCRVCDLDIEREIPATGHEAIESVMRASTDEHAAYGGDGAYTTACDICNEVFEQIFFARPAEYILSTSECTYNGKVRKPSVTVKDADGKKLVEGTDYDVIYPYGMKLPGKYDIEIFFKGNYLGGKHLTFTILPKATTGVKAKTQTTDSITLTWSKTTGATGYRVYQYSSSKGEYVVKASVKGATTYKVTGLKAGTTYKFKIKPYVKADDGTVIWGKASSAFETCTKPAKPTIKSLTASSGKATLTWNNISGEIGYQIYYSTSKNGTYKKLTNLSADATKFTTSKLTAGKTYYFKVRAYKKVDGNTVYGDFSAVKSVKIK